MTNSELGQAINDAWNRYSYDLLMNSEGKDYKFSDIAKAFHEGADIVLRILGIVNDKGEYTNDGEI